MGAHAHAPGRSPRGPPPRILGLRCCRGGAAPLLALMLAVSCALDAAPGPGSAVGAPPPRLARNSPCPPALPPGWRVGRLALRGGQGPGGAGGVGQAEAPYSDFQEPDSEASANPADFQEPATSDDDLIDPDVPLEEQIAQEMGEQERAAGGGGGEGWGAEPAERMEEEEEISDEALKSEPDWDDETREAAAQLRNRTVPLINETISLESLTLDHSIQKHAMTMRRPNDTARPERGHEVFFHFRGFYGDVPFEDSRARDGNASKPLSLRLGTDKRAGPGGDFPYMDAWEIVVRSLARGEVALFLVKGAKRAGEMLRADVSQAPDWVPRDGRGVLRFEVELINFGFKEVVEGGGVLYKCVWDGSGEESPLAHDEVRASVTVRRGGELLCSTKGVRGVQLGVGLLPAGVEAALVREFRKGSAGVVAVNGSHARQAPPGDAPEQVEGLAAALREGVNVWAGLCGGSLGSVEPVLDWGAVGEGGGGGGGCEYDIELKDWNEVHNMSVLDPRAQEAEQYASHGDVIVKNLGHREGGGIEDIQDGDTIMLSYKLRRDTTARRGGDATLAGAEVVAGDVLLGAESEAQEDVDDWWDADLQQEGEGGRGGGRGGGDGSSEELNPVERLIDVDSEVQRPRRRKRGRGGVVLEAEDATEPAVPVTVGNGDLPPGLDLGLTKTRSGGTSVITVLMEDGRHQVYDVFVEALVQSKFELPWGERLRLAEMRKAQGNAYFSKNQTLKALSKYRFAAQLLILAQSTDYVSGEEDKENERLAMLCRTACQINSAVCLMKLSRPELARGVCNQALVRDGNNAKALFWRAKAHRELGMLDSAKADLQRLLELKPNEPEASIELKEVRKLQHAEDAKAAPVFRRMFGESKGKKQGPAKKLAATAPRSGDLLIPPEMRGEGALELPCTSETLGKQQHVVPAGDLSRRTARPPELEGPALRPDVITPGTRALADYTRTNNTQYLTEFLEEHEPDGGGLFYDKINDTFIDMTKKALGVPPDKDGPEDNSDMSE